MEAEYRLVVSRGCVRLGGMGSDSRGAQRSFLGVEMFWDATIVMVTQLCEYATTT